MGEWGEVNLDRLFNIDPWEGVGYQHKSPRLNLQYKISSFDIPQRPQVFHIARLPAHYRRFWWTDANPQVSETPHAAQRLTHRLPVIAKVGGPLGRAPYIEPREAHPLEMDGANQVPLSVRNLLEEQFQDGDVVEVKFCPRIENGRRLGVPSQR